MVSTLVRRKALALGVLLFLGFAFLVHAQAQSAPPVVQVRIDGKSSGGKDEEIIRTSGGSAKFTFTVSFVCQSGGEYGPCSGSQVGETDVEVEVESASTYPSGWSVSGDSGSFKMKAKETKSLTVTVKLTSDDPSKDKVVVELKATAQPVVNAPIPGLPPQLGQASTATDDVTAQKIFTVAEEITYQARRFMWPLLGAAAVLLVAGVVLVEKRRGAGLKLSSTTPSQMIQPGRSASYPVRIQNDARDSDRVQLVTGELPPAWSIVVPLAELDLRGGEGTQLWVTVRAPGDASPGQSLSVDVRARSSVSPRRDSVLSLGVRVADFQAAAEQPEEPDEPPQEPAPASIELEAEAPPAPPLKRVRATPSRKRVT